MHGRSVATAMAATLLAAAPGILITSGVPAASAAASTSAPAGGDITGLITANGGRDDVVLKGGDYTITIPATGPKVQEDPLLPATPETVYHGRITGTGTLTVKPSPGQRATLVMTGLSTFALPAARRRTWANKQPFATYGYDGVRLNGGASPWDVDVLHGRTNDPVMTIAKGAIVHLDDRDGGRANIESYAGAGGAGAGAYNHDAIRVDGTLVFTNNHHSPYESTVGPLSGTGDFLNHLGGFRMSGNSTISGSVVMHGANINGAWAAGELTGTSKIYNDLDLAYGATPKTVGPAGDSSPGVEVVPQTIYECCYGNAVYNIGAGEVRFTGMYSYSDSQDQLHPALSNPKLNFVAFPKGNSQRIVDLGQGITTFGDGTDADFWLPSGWGNTYIGTHRAYALGFDYNGPVRMNTPINSAAAVDSVNLFIKGTPGNRVIVTQPLYYHGFTEIDRRAVLQLGDGTRGNRKQYTFYNKQIRGMDTGTYSTSSGSGRILTADVAPGAAGDKIIDNGTLVVANAHGSYSGVGALRLSDISGRGGLEQHGPATLTLLSHITFRGPTTVSGGTLALAASRRGIASLASSSGVTLSGRSAQLDLTQAGASQTLHDLAGVNGSRIHLGGHPLVLQQDHATAFAGTIDDGTHAGGSVVLSGTGQLTLTGRVATAGPLRVRSGVLVLHGGARRGAQVSGAVNVSTGAVLAAAAAHVGALNTTGSTRLNGNLAVDHDLTQGTGGTLTLALGAPSGTPRIIAGGHVRLAGRLLLTGVPTHAGPTTLIDVAGQDPVQGGFSGLAEGALINLPEASATLSYRGGDGNDVVLVVRRTGTSGSEPGSGSPVSGPVRSLGKHPLLLGGAAALMAVPPLLIFVRRRRNQRPPP